MDMSDRAKPGRGRMTVPPAPNHNSPDWPRWLDRSLTERFPDIGWTIFWDVTAGFLGAYVTQRGDRKPLTKEQRTYIDGWMAGRDALIEYLEQP